MNVLLFASFLMIFPDGPLGQDKEECVGDMITYAYTECDINKGRWRVAIPRNDQCELRNPEPPVFGKQCGFSCKRGEYLDLDTQKCKRCPPGTYSLGSGIRFNSWETLPEGFTVSSSSFSFSEYGYHAKVENCSTSKWKPQSDYISSNDDDCSSVLSYAINVKIKGTVTFTYQFTDEDMIFHFYVQNGQCQSLRDDGRNVFLNTTGTSWAKYTVDLDEGTNILIWKTTGLLLGTKKKLRPALIKDIEITGVSYTTTCHQCSPGFFTDVDGSDYCKSCPTNTFSKVRAKKCTPCEAEIEYSGVASTSCSERPACTENDYFETHSPCSANKTTHVTYKWREPKICRDEKEGSVKLPPSGVQKECPPCNRGFYPSDSGKCLPCPKGMYSDGKSQCKQCSVGTYPNHGFYYNWWDSIPDNVAVSCMTIHSQHCIGEQGWVPLGATVESSQNEVAAGYLLLKVEIIGFRSFKAGLNGLREYGNLTVVFELDCSENCVMYLMKNVKNGGTDILGAWHRKTPKQSFSYSFAKNETMNITFAFQKTSHLQPSSASTSVVNDRAKIYSIVVANAIDAPADGCLSCGAGVDSAGCVPCPAGNFIDAFSTCLPCPDNTFQSYETIQDSNCTSCLEGTESNKDRTACQNDCHFTALATGRQYDFTVLSKPQIAMSPPGFTNSGRKYFHSYNFSICGNNGFGTAECFDNKTFSKSVPYGRRKIQAMICRSTKLFTAGAGNEEIALFTQPEAMASLLEKVYLDTGNENSTNNSGKECDSTELFFPSPQDQEHKDVMYVFSSDQSSTECSGGRKTTLYLRCDPEVSAMEAAIEMPVRYPDGTCDGCHFHFLWRSVDACPLCTGNDYEAIAGSCKDGWITTKYIWKSWPKACKDGIKLPDYSKEPCIDMKLYVEISVLGGVLLLVILLAVSCSLWKKSRKLEYKYQKLVNDSGRNSGHLPTADSCAISSSEPENSDNEEVMFRKKRQKLLGKTKETEKIPLNSMRHNVNM